MRSRARAVVERGGTLRELVSQPPLTLRRLRDADRSTCALALVGSAAGPLDGDDLHLELIALPDAQLTLVAAGATIALGGGSGSADAGPRADPARLTTSIEVGAGARLAGAPGALIVSSGARLAVAVCVRLSRDAHLDWTEQVVLGRTGERPGSVSLQWNVERSGEPLLRQAVDLGDERLRAWPGTIGGARVLATRLRVGPHVKARTYAVSTAAAVHALAADAELITVLAPDAVAAQRQLADLADLAD